MLYGIPSGMISDDQCSRSSLSPLVLQGTLEPCMDLATQTALNAIESTDLALFNPNLISA